MVAAVAGCDIPKRPPLGGGEKSTLPEEELSIQSSTKIVEPPQTPFGQDWESWDVYFLKGKRVGFSHLAAKGLLGEAIRQGSDPNVRYSLQDQIRIQQGGAGYVQYLEQTSTESSLGVLLDFDSSLHIGPIVRRFRGVVEDNQLTVESIEAGQSSRQTTPWDSTNRGLVAVQQSLRRKPMIDGERRSLKGLSPIQYQLMSIRMHCTGESAVPLIDGEYEKLLEIEVKYVVAADLVIDQTIWTNPQGEIQKTMRPFDGLVSYRTDRDTALAGGIDPGQVLKATTIALKGKLDRPQKASRVAFVVRPTPAAKRAKTPIQIGAFPGQFVRTGADNLPQVLVTATDADRPEGFQETDLKPEPSDLAASRFVDFNARLVTQLATAAGKLVDGDERRLALALASTVNTLMTQRDMSRGLTPASMIATNAREGGGCLEHAIFLTAMLRARKIPARLALGFKYEAGEQPSMAFHVWNLAYVNNQWISLDAMSGTTPPADRIIVSTSALDGTDDNLVFQSIFESLGRFVLEIRGASY